MQQHRYPFFGKKVGILFDSADWQVPHVYMRFIKKKPTGVWEKPSAQEGKVIKFNLLEIISIKEVITHPGSKWSTVHRFQHDSTPITFEHKGTSVQILLPGYQKYLNLTEATLLADLFSHVYAEKIEHATGVTQNPPVGQESEKPTLPPTQANQSSHSNSTSSGPKPEARSQPVLTNSNRDLPEEKVDLEPSNTARLRWLQALPMENEYYLLPGFIEARSNKAIAFQIEQQQSTWIPLSCIKEMVDEEDRQGIWVKKWFVEKRLEDIYAES